jgi:hypothetical protein
MIEEQMPPDVARNALIISFPPLMDIKMAL